MAFIDEIQISIKAGRGGDGVVRWRREKFKPLSGPGGGYGGRGGDVYAEAVTDLAYLEHYQFEKKFKAENGDPGGNFGREGKSGKELVLRFPVGSRLTNVATGQVIELDHAGDRVLLLKGGDGGKGNEHFKSSRNTTPYESTPGKLGEEADLHIELRLIADIGLVGFPNAGKSTLLNALTNAKSKVGSYQFTTLDPHLGVMPGGFVIADIPGLIEGASTGKGLGDKFLRHISRTKTLVHLVSLENEDIAMAYETIRNELGAYDPVLLEKQEIVVLSKTDVISEDELAAKIKEIKKVSGKEPVAITEFDSDSIKILQDTIIKLLQKQNKV